MQYKNCEIFFLWFVYCQIWVEEVFVIEEFKTSVCYDIYSQNISFRDQVNYDCHSFAPETQIIQELCEENEQFSSYFDSDLNFYHYIGYAKSNSAEANAEID